MAITSATATAVIGGEVAKSVLESVEETLDRITENIAIKFRNLAEDLLSQIRVSVEELWKQIADDVDRLVSELVEHVRVQLYALTIAANDLAKMVANEFQDVTQEAIRELRQTISRTWFFNEIYALDEIEGTLILADVQSDWTISASGLNLGYDSEDIESLVDLVLKIPNAPDMRISGAEASSTRVEFTIPIEVIEELRRDQTATVVSGFLDIFFKKDGILFFNKKFRKQQSLKVIIAPRVSGSLSVRTENPHYDWVRRPELDKEWPKHLPSGHATSTSKIGHHRINHLNNRIPRASVPPKPNDIRYSGARFVNCKPNVGHGNGCGHLHNHDVSVAENGSNLHIFTYNNSHAVIAVFRGEIERFEKVSTTREEHGRHEIRHGEVLQVIVPMSAGLIVIQGTDQDFGQVDLVVERDPTQDILPMPQGVFGGLVYLGSHVEDSKAIYRFSRRVPELA